MIQNIAKIDNNRGDILMRKRFQRIILSKYIISCNFGIMMKCRPNLTHYCAIHHSIPKNKHTNHYTFTSKFSTY